MMFKVYFPNHGYASERRFDTFEAALTYAKSVCFQAQILEAGQLVASWCPIGGTRHYDYLIK